LACHYTREAIASKAVDFRHLPGDLNIADILSKHWGYAQVWPMLRAVMFWTGNPSDLLLGDTPQPQQEGSEKCPVSMGNISNPEGDSSMTQTVTPNHEEQKESSETGTTNEIAHGKTKREPFAMESERS
jgi:hypothetical protein